MKEIKDIFGVVTSDYVTIGKYKIDKNNPDLSLDYFNKNVYCHPDFSAAIFCEFDEMGNLKGDGKKVYTNEKHFYDYFPQIFCQRIYKNGQMELCHVGIPFEFIPMELFKECIYDGIYYHKDLISTAPKKHLRYRQINAIKKLHDCNSIKDELKYGIKSSTYLLTEGKRYTFGAEIETSNGLLPYYLDKDLNYEAVHDGSLRDENGNVNGGEYVTGVLIGDSGFLQLKRLCNELNKRCLVNSKCGVHVHIGGVNFNKEFIVHLYKLCQDIEEELFAMLPVSRRNNEYCKPLKKFNFKTLKTKDRLDYQMAIDAIYSDLFCYIAHSQQADPARSNKKTQHPLGNKCGYNHSTARYCWLNLVPAMFDTRGNGKYTVEIRNHSGTTSYTKIKNWILITMGIMSFAENEQEFIRYNKVCLSDVIQAAFPKKALLLMKYIHERTNKFTVNSVDQEYMDYTESEVSSQLTLTTI